ncbi:MAG: hypothetical protein MJ252_01150 [archaeon]|nr:hypothetical protein [archaeon]
MPKEMMKLCYQFRKKNFTAVDFEEYFKVHSADKEGEEISIDEDQMEIDPEDEDNLPKKDSKKGRKGKTQNPTGDNREYANPRNEEERVIENAIRDIMFKIGDD